MKKIEIASTITIVVSPDLKIIDLTDKTTVNPNKMRAKMDWDVKPVQIMKGKHIYPHYITEWETTMNLLKSGYLTFGNIIEEEEEPNPVDISKELSDMKKQVEGQAKEIASLKKGAKPKPKAKETNEVNEINETKEELEDLEDDLSLGK